MENLTNISANKLNSQSIYSNLNITKKQFENCLLPLWIYGEATSYEISKNLQIPIIEIVVHFKTSSKDNLIQVHPIHKSKFNPISKKHNINYILTRKGKDTVSKAMAFIKNPKEVA